MVTPEVSAPVHHTDRATLFCAAAEDVLPTLQRGSVGLLVTDPPYGQSFQSGRRKDTYALVANDDGSFDVAAVIGLALPAMQKRRHLYIFGPADLTGLPVTAPATLIWDKRQLGMGDLSLPWAPAHEPIQFAMAGYSKAERAQGEGGLSARLRRGSVLRSARIHGSATHHPNEKPIDLMRQIVEASSLVGDLVLDPFAGSGSTLVAAVLTGRRAIGIEIDGGYAAIAVERLKAAEVLALAMEDA